MWEQIKKFSMGIFIKMISRSEGKITNSFENLQVLLESDIILLIGNIQLRGIFQVKRLFQKLRPLLYKRAELDLRLTKKYIA